MNTRTSSLPAQTFSSIARSLGVKYLMFHGHLQDFAKIAQLAVGERTSYPQNSGLIARNVQVSLQSENWRFRPDLIPLMESHKGKWLGQIVTGGGSLIADGFSIVSTFGWHVGFLLPVDLIDSLAFRVVSKGFDDRWANPPIFWPQEFENRTEQLELFRRALARGISCEDLDDTAKPAFHFQFVEEYSLKQTEIIWIPAPLLRWIQAFSHLMPQLPRLPAVSMWYEGLPNPFPATQMQIAVAAPNTERGYRDVPPEPPRADEIFSPETRIGTWYTTMPDWNLVQAAIRESKATPTEQRRIEE